MVAWIAGAILIRGAVPILRRAYVIATSLVVRDVLDACNSLHGDTRVRFPCRTWSDLNSHFDVECIEESLGALLTE